MDCRLEFLIGEGRVSNKMNKKLLIMVLFLAVFVGIILIFTIASQRHGSKDKEFVRVVVWRSFHYEDNPRVHYFTINHNGTLTSYIAIARTRHNISADNFINSIEYREEIVLNNQDFRRLYRLARDVIAVEGDFSLWIDTPNSMLNANLYYDGNTYGIPFNASGQFHRLVEELYYLSPLWPYRTERNFWPMP